MSDKNNGGKSQVFILLAVAMFIFAAVFGYIAFAQPKVGTKSNNEINTVVYSPSFSDQSVETTAHTSDKINLNTCTVDDLLAIDGIGESRAKAIVAYREQIGAYKSVEEIKNISGIGDATYEALAPYLTVQLMIKEMFSALSDMLFPKRCALCGEVVEIDEELCPDCKALKRVSAPLCLKCGCEKSECVCKKSKHSPEYKAVVAPYYYEHGGCVAKGVLNLKMHDMPQLAIAQGDEISKAVSDFYELVHFDYATFVPMSFYAERQREFNQAKLLAERVGQNLKIPVKTALRKKHKTKMQKRQSAADRFVNMYNAFDLADNSDVAGKTILLIDDVKTTGATLSSAALTLKAYGR